MTYSSRAALVRHNPNEKPSGAHGDIYKRNRAQLIQDIMKRVGVETPNEIGLVYLSKEQLINLLVALKQCGCCIQ